MTNIKTNLRLIVFLACVFIVVSVMLWLKPNQLFFLVANIWGQNDEKTLAFLKIVTPEVFVQAKWILGILFSSLCFILHLDPRLIIDYGRAFKQLIVVVSTELRSLGDRRRVYFYGLIVTGSLVLITWCFIFPLQLDELHTWMFFVERGPMVVLSYYPGSNNHIAYNLLSLVWNSCLSPRWAIRIVSLLSTIGCWILFAMILRKIYNDRMAIIGLLLLMSSFHFIWYGSQGRGYVLEMFCLLFMWYVILAIENERFQVLLMVFFGVLAVYTVPVAIIPTAVLGLFWCGRMVNDGAVRWRIALQFLVYTAIGIAICYAPVFIMSGPMAVLNNPYVKQLNGSEWLSDTGRYIGEIILFISGGEAYWAVPVLLFLLGGSIFMSFRGRYHWVLWCLVLSIPLGLLVVYPVLLFDRTWLWLIVPFIGWLVNILYVVEEKNRLWAKLCSWGLVVAWIGCNGWELHKAYVLVKATDDTILSIQQEIEQHLVGKTLRVDDDALYNHLRYYWLQHPDYNLEYSAISQNDNPDAVLGKRTKEMIEDHILWKDNDHVLYLRHSKF